jgi:hypothetical protein
MAEFLVFCSFSHALVVIAFMYNHSCIEGIKLILQETYTRIAGSREAASRLPDALRLETNAGGHHRRHAGTDVGQLRRLVLQRAAARGRATHWLQVRRNLVQKVQSCKVFFIEERSCTRLHCRYKNLTTRAGMFKKAFS